MFSHGLNLQTNTNIDATDSLDATLITPSRPLQQAVLQRNYAHQRASNATFSGSTAPINQPLVVNGGVKMSRSLVNRRNPLPDINPHIMADNVNYSATRGHTVAEWGTNNATRIRGRNIATSGSGIVTVNSFGTLGNGEVLSAQMWIRNNHPTNTLTIHPNRPLHTPIPNGFATNITVPPLTSRLVRVRYQNGTGDIGSNQLQIRAGVGNEYDYYVWNIFGHHATWLPNPYLEVSNVAGTTHQSDSARITTSTDQLSGSIEVSMTFDEMVYNHAGNSGASQGLQILDSSNSPNRLVLQLTIDGSVLAFGAQGVATSTVIQNWREEVFKGRKTFKIAWDESHYRVYVNGTLRLEVGRPINTPIPENLSIGRFATNATNAGVQGIYHSLVIRDRHGRATFSTFDSIAPTIDVIATANWEAGVFAHATGNPHNGAGYIINTARAIVPVRGRRSVTITPTQPQTRWAWHFFNGETRLPMTTSWNTHSTTIRVPIEATHMRISIGRSHMGEHPQVITDLEGLGFRVEILP